MYKKKRKGKKEANNKEEQRKINQEFLCGEEAKELKICLFELYL